MDREDHAIADAVSQHFPLQAQKLRTVQERLSRLPNAPWGPAAFQKLEEALEQCIRICRQTHPTVKLVKKHLDALNDGVQLVQIYDAELTADAIRAVSAAHDVVTFQAAQLQEIGVRATNVEAAVTRASGQLAAERPWLDISSLDEDLEEIRNAYLAERQRLLGWQEQQAEQTRARVKGRDGFSTLTNDQAHKVLRPIAGAVTTTTADAIAPSLAALKDPFSQRLRAAEDAANEVLDSILSEGDKPLVIKVDLRLRNRELKSEADVEALVGEIRKRLVEQIRSGARIRLL